MQLRNRKLNTKQWKGKFTGRKGMGMELALLVLLVVFGCSTLLVSSAMIGKSNMTRQQDRLEERLVLDQLAEDFCASADQANWIGAAFYQSYKDEFDAVVIIGDTVLTEEHFENPEAAESLEVSEPSESPEPEEITLMLGIGGEAKLTVSIVDGIITQWTYH